MKDKRIMKALTGLLSLCVLSASPMAMAMPVSADDTGIVYGDANCDEKVNLSDAVLIMQNLANPSKYGVNGSNEIHITQKGVDNADVYNRGDGLTNSDALAIQKYLLKLTDLPESISPDYDPTTTTTTSTMTTTTTTPTTTTTTSTTTETTTTTTETTTTTTTTETTTTTTTTTAPIAQNVTPAEYMAAVKANFTSNVPSDVKTGDSGTTSKIKYFSKKAQREKPANVWLPPNYSENEKYPVVYMNHGVMGSEDDLVSGWSIREMASNLIKKGEVKPFIIVFTQMYTDPNSASAGGITQEAMDHYDDFLYDLTESLMPYMSEHYSVAEGRDNTAIAGFSMGGRESLYIGLKAADKIGYVCASSPAPGIVPAQDMFLNHRGSMTENEFKFSEPYIPYLLMIGGGTNDSVVGTFPKQYHELFDKNGTDNIWFEVPGAGHDASVGTPLFYNFFRNLFKTEGGFSTEQGNLGSDNGGNTGGNDNPWGGNDNPWGGGDNGGFPWGGGWNW